MSLISFTYPKGSLIVKTKTDKKYSSRQRRNEEGRRGKLFSKHSFPGRMEKAENAVKLNGWDKIKSCEELLINSIVLWDCLRNASLKAGSFKYRFAFSSLTELLFAFARWGHLWTHEHFTMEASIPLIKYNCIEPLFKSCEERNLTVKCLHIYISTCSSVLFCVWVPQQAHILYSRQILSLLFAITLSP